MAGSFKKLWPEAAISGPLRRRGEWQLQVRDKVKTLHKDPALRSQEAPR